MKKKINLSTTHIIMFSFLAALFVGSILLALPISSADGNPVPYIDALFTATTATCVTGLVTLPTATTWSTFGHIVIMLLIQVGGLGVITVAAAIMVTLHRKIGMKDRALIQDAFNLNTMSGIIRFIKNVIIGTFVVEGVGAILYMFVFVPEFGARGIWISIFNSISAFCNAGMDIIGENSLCDYAFHPLINFVTCSLIILGGIGYIVWWDIVRMVKAMFNKKTRNVFNLTLHCKIALSATAICIIGGAAAFFIFEYNNPLTMQGLSWFDRIQLSVFQSVTTRTAGFVSMPQESMTNASAIVSLLLMFIGGSPVGTAGGIKTVTVAVLFCAAFATMKNEDEVVLFQRNIPREAISKAVAVTCTSFLIMIISTILLSLVCEADSMAIAYETVSATATVGLSMNLTSSLNVWGKMIIIATMYLGRVGPISLVIAFNRKKGKKNIIKNPTEEISIG